VDDSSSNVNLLATQFGFDIPPSTFQHQPTSNIDTSAANDSMSSTGSSNKDLMKKEEAEKSKFFTADLSR
jgi:hypothetical protein